METKKAIIIGGGPAGLTAAYELVQQTAIQPIVIEKDQLLGGISKTVNYKGNRMDIGGHRFFSKSDTVMNWWLNVMPQETPATPAAEHDNVMLVRNRISRIYFLRKFFDYPISLTLSTIKKLGLIRIIKIGCSYLYIRIRPIKHEASLEDFYINRFGRQLYNTFFRDYTEKVWGTKCSNISPEWGSQRVKGLSISKALLHAIKKPFTRSKGVSQKETETSLIEKFLYPKLGPGQLWDNVGRKIVDGGGEIHKECTVVALHTQANQITGVTVRDKHGAETHIEADYVLSTMPVKDLINALQAPIPEDIHSIANGLVYRDFMTVGLLLDKMKVPAKLHRTYYPDTWIYIQEHRVKLGRVQLFNNWSPYMVHDQDKVWIGLEYFVTEGDALWNMADETFIAMAVDELASIGLISKEDVQDATLLRVEKAYPAYFGSYAQMSSIVEYVSQFENLFLIGRNGMHKYNNQDHSMLTAMAAVDNIRTGRKDQTNIWAINTEQEYHEAKDDEQENVK